MAFAITWSHGVSQAQIAFKDYVWIRGPIEAEIYFYAHALMVSPKVARSMGSELHSLTLLVPRGHAATRAVLVWVRGATT